MNYTGIPVYDKAIEYLEDFRPQYATIVYAMGEPVANPAIPTLQVSTDRNDPKAPITLSINPDYLPDAEPENCAAMLIHEAIHILKSHLAEMAKGHEEGKNMDSLVKSHESIVNDYLDYLDFELPDANLPDGTIVPARQNYIFGFETVGVSTVGMDTEEVYNLIPNDSDDSQDDGDGEDSDSEGDSQDNSGNGSRGSSESSNGNDGDSDSNDGSSCSQGGSESDVNGSCGHDHGDFMNSDDAADVQKKFMKFINDNIDDMPDDFVDEMDEIDSDDSDSDDDVNTRNITAGDGFDEVQAEEVAAKYGTTKGWMKFLHEIAPDFLRKKGAATLPTVDADWSRPNRLTAGLPDSFIMPAYNSPEGNKPELDEDGEDMKPHIVFGLDASMSIPRETVTRMRELMASIPTDLIDVDAFTFSTNFIEYDFDARNPRIASGGTSFLTAESFMKYKGIDPNKDGLKVVMLTDGGANYHYPKNPESFVWVLFDRADINYSPREFKTDGSEIRFMDEFFPEAVMNSTFGGSRW